MPTPKKPLIDQAVKLGVAYGPVVYAALKKTGWSPETLLHRAGPTSADPRADALEHADHLLDGSVITVFEGDKRVFVVFSGDKPVASHPQTRTPLTRLVEGYDLTKRVRPGDPAARPGGRGRQVPNPLRRRRDGADQTPAAPRPGTTSAGTGTPAVAPRPAGTAGTPGTAGASGTAGGTGTPGSATPPTGPAAPGGPTAG